MPEGLAEAREGCAEGGGQPLPVGSAAEVRAEWRDSGRTASPESRRRAYRLGAASKRALVTLASPRHEVARLGRRSDPVGPLRGGD